MLYVPICHADFDESMFNISEMLSLGLKKKLMNKINTDHKSYFIIQLRLFFSGASKSNALPQYSFTLPLTASII